MMTDATDPAAERPAVSVVMPFHGHERAAAAALARLEAIRLRPGDEATLVDNTVEGVAGSLAGAASVAVLHAPAEQSSYHARNTGASAARAGWILFVDADCLPPGDIIDRYLAGTVRAEIGMLVGPIDAARGQSGLLVEWAVTREILSQERSLEREPRGAATANVLVRRSAWAGVGGFQEGIRSGGDHEFCWRILDAGWRIEARPAARVEHVHRTSLGGIARQMARYAAGNAWQRRRRPESVPRHKAAGPLARAALGAPFFAFTLRPRRAALKLVDLVAVLAQAAGQLLSNSVRAPLDPRQDRLVVATDRFPVGSETFVTGEIAALRSLGREVRVEAIARPDAPAHEAARGLDIRYLEDESPLSRAKAALWIASRHPIRALADRRLRAAFADEWLPLTAVAPIAKRLADGRERHVHVHFVALASVCTLRAARIAGSKVSVAAHGHDVFKTPRALSEKLAMASFVAAPCQYTAKHLREISPTSRVEVVVMGVDGHRFERRTPYPGGRTALAVGRLVQKKGFADLVRAAAALEAHAPLDRALVIGAGPLEDQLRRLADELGVSHRVRLAGALLHDEVRAALEEADVLVMPCVIAPDGDRDAMPVVVKEALALEVPVVATDEVGLPEIVHSGWGRLVPPGRPDLLADAIGSLLDLSPGIRAAMGAEGRRFVLAELTQEAQARKLLALIEGSSS